MLCATVAAASYLDPWSEQDAGIAPGWANRSADAALAPEAPHPAPVEDIYSVFVWLHANAGQLGLDTARIGTKGESGGGGFAAGSALYDRDRRGPSLAFSHLTYLPIDFSTASSPTREFL